jgi:hypothetical protein
VARKCWLCKERDAIWACQPHGPGEQTSWSFLGSHYRGFPVYPLCDTCKERVGDGDPTVLKQEARA